MIEIGTQLAEPVAWRYGHYGNVLLTHDKDIAKDAAQFDLLVQPLYLHPPAAEVQRLIAAARAVVSTWYTASSESAVDTFEVMRAALDALEGASDATN